jgi:hypothetical protein
LNSTKILPDTNEDNNKAEEENLLIEMGFELISLVAIFMAKNIFSPFAAAFRRANERENSFQIMTMSEREME